MSKERPILFSTPMVRAILSGSKTQTRRIVKMKPSDWCKEIKGDCWHPNEIAEWRLQDGRWFGLMGWYTLAFADFPYGQICDRLWVREGMIVDGYLDLRYAADDELVEGNCNCNWKYRDDEYVGGIPSIHMPRWASRILLEITNVRVERLQDISEADAVAEGIQHSDINAAAFRDYLDEFGWCGDAKTSYRTLWESINDPSSWDANPWVWVVEFKRIQTEARG